MKTAAAAAGTGTRMEEENHRSLEPNPHRRLLVCDSFCNTAFRFASNLAKVIGEDNVYMP